MQRAFPMLLCHDVICLLFLESFNRLKFSTSCFSLEIVLIFKYKKVHRILEQMYSSARVNKCYYSAIFQYSNKTKQKLQLIFTNVVSRIKKTPKVHLENCVLSYLAASCNFPPFFYLYILLTLQIIPLKLCFYFVPPPGSWKDFCNLVLMAYSRL